MKSTKNLGTLGLLGCALLASQSARADEPAVNPEWADSAWYVGAGIGRAQASVDEERLTRSLMAGGANSVLIRSDERDTAYQVFLGRQLSKNFALEGGYFDLGQFGFNATALPATTLNGQVGFRGVNLDLLAQLPLSQRFSVYGRFGMQYAKASAHFSGNRLFGVTDPERSERKLNPKVGLGLEYKLTEALAVRGDVTRYRLNDALGNRGDVDSYSINLVYKLGKPASQAPARVAPPPAPEPRAALVVTPPPPPAQPAPAPVSEKVTFAAQSLFDFDKSTLKPEGQAALNVVLKQRQGTDTEVIIVVGHTDSVGSEDYNQKLSMRRAQTVKAYLISQGVEAARIYTEGKGEAQPAVDNHTAEGRAKNRRVIVEVVGTRIQAR